MKLLLILLLLITACTNKKSEAIPIPIGATDTIPTNKKGLFSVQKSPGEQHQFEVNTRMGDSAIIKNHSK